MKHWLAAVEGGDTVGAWISEGFYNPERVDPTDPRDQRAAWSDLTANIKAHRARQLEHRLAVGPGWMDGGTVFAMVDGRPWHPNVVSRAFERLVTRSGLPKVRFHDHRHTHASRLLAASVNVKVVSDRLGHASTSFTLDTYAHVMPGQQAGAAAAAAALVDTP